MENLSICAFVVKRSVIVSVKDSPEQTVGASVFLFRCNRRGIEVAPVV